MVSNNPIDQHGWQLVIKQINHMKWQLDDILDSKRRLRSHNISFLILQKEKIRAGMPYNVNIFIDHFVSLDDEHISALRRIEAQVELLDAIVNNLKNWDSKGF